MNCICCSVFDAQAGEVAGAGPQTGEGAFDVAQAGEDAVAVTKAGGVAVDAAVGAGGCFDITGCVKLGMGPNVVCS